MIIQVRNKTGEFNGYRASRVKSLFNAESGSEFNLDANLPIEDLDWQIGLIVGASGSGKTSIEWAIRMKEAITGGTVFWLNGGIDRGDIAYQKFCFIDPKLLVIDPNEAAKELWRSDLLQMGVELMAKAICDIRGGKIIKKPQDTRFSTFEPSISVSDIYKPDLLMLDYNAS